MKQDSQFTYTYDAFGRLTNIVGEDQSIEYAYNARHQRVRKTVNGKNTYFQYDNSGRLLVEQDSTGKAVSESIYLGLRPVGQLVFGMENTVNTLSKTVYKEPVFKADKDRFVLSDKQGNKLKITVKPDTNKLVIRHPDGTREVIIPNVKLVYKPNKVRLQFRHEAV